ncbi:MAG TPA: hypothetical protein VLI68_07295 [Hanamia sp.]|nr:hypothetical protein [Hanamia sp.]
MRSNKRGMAISIFVIIISVFNFERLTDSDCIRAIHVVTLLVCGMAIGIFLMNFFGWLRTKRN